MHGKSFLERFRSKHAPPPNSSKQQKSSTPRPRTKRLMGAPLEFVADVCRSTEGRAALVVALYIIRRVHISGDRMVTLPSAELTELGIGRQDKQRALAKLQRAGLIEVKNVRGRTAVVHLIWRH